MRIGVFAFVLLALVGCRPAELRPLDYAPPPGARELYHFTPDRALRYDGHWVRDSVGEQMAGDVETRARSFAPPDKDTPWVDLVTVSPLGTKAYYDSVARLLDSDRPQVIVTAIGLKGDESDPRRARRGRDLEDDRARDIRALFPDLTFPRDALPWDERCQPPQFTADDVAVIESMSASARHLTDEEREDLERLASWVGSDVLLHFAILNELMEDSTEVSVGETTPPLEDEKPRYASYEDALAAANKLGKPERDTARMHAFMGYRLPVCMLEAMDLAAAMGARRIVLLTVPECSLRLSLELTSRGYKVERERWLKAIPLLSDHPPPAER
jgi:hypothetical protein